MIVFTILPIQLTLFCISYDRALATNINASREYTAFLPENLASRENSNLSNFLFTRYDSLKYVASGTELQSNEVDCFGLGKTVAIALQWFFASKPNGSNALDVRFFLSSRKQPQRVEVIIGKQFGLEWTDFKIERRTIVIVHGFLSHGQTSWIADLEKAFLRWDDVNVAVVDWSSGGNTWNYYRAAVNTKIVGYQIARFLEHIDNATAKIEGANADNWGPLYFVGHSLGAHICGFAAKELRKRSSRWKLERITGLDPAQPCFKDAHATMKLHKTDAPFVDVIHTNGRLLSQIGLGLPEPIGHVDFYPNGGKSQPGCSDENSSSFDYLQIPVQLITKSICSHGRSYVYLTESLINAREKTCTFWAHYWDMTYRNFLQIATESCDTNICSEMGINAMNHPQRGTFFVATSNDEPFCINSTDIIEEVKIQLAEDHVDDLQD